MLPFKPRISLMKLYRTYLEVGYRSPGYKRRAEADHFATILCRLSFGY